MWKWLYQLASPKTTYQICLRLSPWVNGLTFLLIISGCVCGLLLAPADYQQGDGFRIIYVHVPSAILSLSIYTFMTFTAVIGLIWHFKLSPMVVRAAAPLGASFTACALITGSIWGKPMWGTWWIWDARLTSELILLFLYLAYLLLQKTLIDRQLAAKAGAVLLLVGFIDIPIIHYAVVWWSTLHQGASLSLFHKPTITGAMLYPLLLMIAGFFSYFISVFLLRLQNEILSFEQHSQWLKELLTPPQSAL
jgi:heme exporter protein C